jgi:hypothetical protein
VEKHGRARDATDDNQIRRMRTARCITKVTDTLRILNTYCFSTVKMDKRTRLSLTFIRIYIACIVFNSCQTYGKYHIL